MAAAWLLNRHHDITIFEQANWVGGHCNTVDVDAGDGRQLPVDTGFIVYNERTYPNLTAMFHHLGVATELSDMSFSASVNNGHFEYSGTSLRTMLAQKRNLVRPRFWSMVRDILRFYKAAPELDHLLPIGSSIWSASLKDMRGYPLAAFVRFFKNHGLLETRNSRRPQWRTVTGGSRAYVQRLTADFADRIRLNSPVVGVRRFPNRVEVTVAGGQTETFDDVVIAAHSDQALAMLSDPSVQERKLLGAIRYERNFAVLHRDVAFMPKRRSAWASWNYISASGDTDSRLVCLTYWMNMLQNIAPENQLFVTLNPHVTPAKQIASFEYDHPIFDMAALDAQQELWSLQGANRTWFCGAYFGHGFHEDGLQAGLAVGEALGKIRRPWDVADESGRIHLHSTIEAAA